jgi:DNA-binding transcriptional MerR regulator
MFTETTTALARDARVTQPTVRKYAALGLLEYIVASDGTLLFQPGQAAKVREIYTRRMNARFSRTG